MSKLIDIEKVKAEIEKLQKEYSLGNSAEAKYRCEAYAELIDFIDGLHEEFEKNRLAACDRQTKEEAQMEQDFCMGIIAKEHRTPTYSDAIKYGIQW